jgi:hypothetical protein
MDRLLPVRHFPTRSDNRALGMYNGVRPRVAEVELYFRVSEYGWNM